VLAHYITQTNREKLGITDMDKIVASDIEQELIDPETAVRNHRGHAVGEVEAAHDEACLGAARRPDRPE